MMLYEFVCCKLAQLECLCDVCVACYSCVHMSLGVGVRLCIADHTLRSRVKRGTGRVFCTILLVLYGPFHPSYHVTSHRDSAPGTGTNFAPWLSGHTHTIGKAGL